MMSCRSPRRAVLSVLIAVAVALVPACSGEDKAEGKKPKTPVTTTTLPADCIVTGSGAPPEGPDGGAGETIAPTTSILQKCLDKAFTEQVAKNGSAGLKKRSKDQLLGFGAGICAYARALAADPSKAPTYDELVKSTSASWKVKPSEFEEILTFAGVLCPNDLKPVLDLKAQAGGGAVQLELSAASASEMEVTYQAPDGTRITGKVQTPWTQAVTLDAPVDYPFTVKVGDGEATCVLKVKEQQVKTATATKDKPADCSATAAELRSANH